MAFNDSTNLNNISKYIVDANGATPYTTIQSAIDAANTAGVAATIYIRPGTYTENLTLYDKINLLGYAGTTGTTGIGGLSPTDPSVSVIGSLTLDTSLLPSNSYNTITNIEFAPSSGDVITFLSNAGTESVLSFYNSRIVVSEVGKTAFSVDGFPAIFLEDSEVTQNLVNADLIAFPGSFQFLVLTGKNSYFATNKVVANSLPLNSFIQMRLTGCNYGSMIDLSGVATATFNLTADDCSFEWNGLSNEPLINYGAQDGFVLITQSRYVDGSGPFSSSTNVAASSTFRIKNTLFTNTYVMDSNCKETLEGCAFFTESSQAITMNSAQNIELSECTIDSTNNPAIGGTGIGTISIGSITFLNNSVIENTLTISRKSFVSGTVRGTTFDTDVDTAAVTLSGTTLSADGTDADIDIDITPKGTGNVNITNRTQNATAYYGTSGALEEIGPLTDGQLIIGSTGNPPVAATLTDGNNITITEGAGTITANLTGTTDHTVQVGNATGSLTSLAAATDGQLIIGSTGADPVVASLTSTGGTVSITPGAGSINLETTSDSAISKYIVDSDGSASYTTIQAAIDAANTAGIPATVYVRPGTYTEDLTLYDGIDIFGAVGSSDTNTCSIIGTHTPPTTGTFTIRNVYLQDGTAIFSSAAAGSATIVLKNCTINMTNGYTFDLLNWTGKIICFGVSQVQSGNDGWIYNVAGASVSLTNTAAGFGIGITKTMTISGPAELYNVHVGCLIRFEGTSVATLDGGCRFDKPVITADSATLHIANSLINSGIYRAITHDSTNTLSLSDVTIDSSNSPCIAGTGTIDIGSITFLNDDNIQGTIGVTRQVLVTGTVRGTVFDTDVATDGVTLQGTTLSADGTDADIDIDLTPKGTGNIKITNRTQNTVAYYDVGGALDEIGPLTDGQLIIGSTGNPPVAANLTSTGGTIVFTPGAGTLNLEASPTSGSSISRYIVAPDGSADYTTIQAALNAANTAGIPATVVVRPASYTENLTLYNGINIWGTSLDEVIITGTHTPPNSGNFCVQNCTLISATDIFYSIAAGTTAIILNNCIYQVTSGYLFNLLAWTGPITVKSSSSVLSGNDGILQNLTGSSLFIVENSHIGFPSTNILRCGGTMVLVSSTARCPINFSGSTVSSFENSSVAGAITVGSTASLIAKNTVVSGAITVSNSAVLDFENCSINGGTSSAITHNSSSAMNVVNTIIKSSASSAITGVGAGLVTLSGIEFTNSSGIGLTLPPLSTVPSTLSSGLQVIEGTNAKMGIATLLGGSVTVNTSAVTAKSRIFLTHQVVAGTAGFLVVSARTAGISFTIASSTAADTSQIGWMIVEPK